MATEWNSLIAWPYPGLDFQVLSLHGLPDNARLPRDRRVDGIRRYHQGVGRPGPSRFFFYYWTGQDVLLIRTIDVKRLERERLSMLTLSDRLFLSYSSPILLVGRVPAVNQWRRRPTSQQLSTGAATPGAYRTRPIRFHQDGRLVGRLPCAHRRSFGILTRITTAPDKNQQQ